LSRTSLKPAGEWGASIKPKIKRTDESWKPNAGKEGNKRRKGRMDTLSNQVLAKGNSWTEGDGTKDEVWFSA